MLATATGAGLYMSSNFGSTWTQVTGTLLSAIWSTAQVSATGQYLIAYSTPVMVQPQLSGLTGNITTTSPVYTSWQTNGITWTSFCSSIVDNNANFQAWVAFNNLGNSSSAPYSWASARNYDATTGAYTGSLSTTIQSVAAQTGEWIQIQSSVPITLYSYNFACGTFAAIPKTYFIIGSNDGSTWYPIQSVSIGTNPFTVDYTVATSAPIIVNQSGSQTMTAGTSGTLTCTTYTTNTTAAYTYFRLIGTSTFGPTLVRCCEFTELYLNFQAGGQTYSTNYGSTWNNGYAVQTPTALSLSESGQYAIGANNSSVYITSNFLQGFSTGIPAIPITSFQTQLNAVTNNPVASAVSNTGQYMVIITNNVSGNNVYYSTNFGAYFAGLILGTTLLTSCAISYDGSYITVSNATTTWTLNNNSNGFSLALGNQAGYQNQGQHAIAIGNGAGSINQTANSIILNASGSAVNAFAPGFYVAPIASYVASSSQSFGLLGYGIGTGGDSQIVQIGNVSITSNILTLNNALSLTGTVYGSTNASAAFWMQANGGTSLYITDSQNSPTMGTTTMGRYFGYGGNIFQDFTGSFIWRTSNLSNTAVNHAMILSSTGVLTVSNVSIFGNSANFQVRMGENCETGGAGNISVGLNIGRAAGTGGNNILYGASVGRALTSGANNVLYGAATGNSITTGSDNVIFGLIAGNSITTGSQNTILGTSSGVSLTTGQFNTYLGYGTTASSGGVNNEVVLGNNITGKGSNTTSFKAWGGANVYIRDNFGYNNTGGFVIDGDGAAGTNGRSLVLGRGDRATGWHLVCSLNDELRFHHSSNSIASYAYLTPASIGLIAVSDANMKKQITNIPTSLNKLLQLRPVHYLLNEEEDDAEPNAGFIAQEVFPIFPVPVYKTEDRYGINYVEFIPYIVKGIQEQQQQIVNQQQQIVNQQQQIVNQQTQIDTLIQRLAAANIA